MLRRAIGGCGVQIGWLKSTTQLFENVPQVFTACARDIALAPLYLAAKRPVVDRGDGLIVDDDAARMRLRSGETIETKSVRFRTLSERLRR